MAKKKVYTRIFCFKKRLVLIRDEKIIGNINIKREVIEAEIIRQEKILVSDRDRSPAIIFAKALEELTSIQFARPSYHYQNQSIHDSEYYRNFLEFIKEQLNTEKTVASLKEIKEGKDKFWKENGPYLKYQASLKQKNQK